jgi:predicted DNA-binding transcriptional regulator YafY
MPAPLHDRGERYQHLALLLDTIRCLCSGWYRVEELGDYLGVSRRTAYRLVLMLINAGMPITRREGRMGTRTIAHYRLDADWWQHATPRRGRATARGRRMK